MADDLQVCQSTGKPQSCGYIPSHPMALLMTLTTLSFSITGPSHQVSWRWVPLSRNIRQPRDPVDPGLLPTLWFGSHVNIATSPPVEHRQAIRAQTCHSGTDMTTQSIQLNNRPERTEGRSEDLVPVACLSDVDPCLTDLPLSNVHDAIK
ncbi:hypothetical protein BC938DRAFT_477371 [Jimgerdemannia flammicorona]|uniref:Uncharacterized protein n=1 Tax=Jimgerdemannia flammicorona TaxID=994334 RepID=A0A433QPF9_9FUNG|nr:hypothetical protein BC938DRAFT_477371 [Jimgerdemannia flammicorona]